MGQEAAKATGEDLQGPSSPSPPIQGTTQPWPSAPPQLLDLSWWISRSHLLDLHGPTWLHRVLHDPIWTFMVLPVLVDLQGILEDLQGMEAPTWARPGQVLEVSFSLLQTEPL